MSSISRAMQHFKDFVSRFQVNPSLARETLLAASTGFLFESNHAVVIPRGTILRNQRVKMLITHGSYHKCWL